MAQTTRTRAWMRLLGVSLTLLPILGVKFPENPNFWGVNRRFQAKLAKYWKFHAIETTASISTKFCTKIETIKNSSGWSQSAPNKSKMADGRHFEKKPLNCYISVTVWLILMRFWYSDAYWPLTADLPLKFRRQPPSGKSQKSRYLRNGLTDLYEIWYADAKWVS